MIETLRLNKVTKQFGNKIILKDLELVVEEGSMIAILGTSGSGKTTLISILGLLDKEFSGQYFLDREKINCDKDYINIRNQKLGFVFQSYHLIYNYTVKENILLPCEYSSIYKKNLPYERLYQITKDLNIFHLLEDKVSYLSGGEKQRIAIARALILNPKVIICDEPTGNLDQKNTIDVMRLLQLFNSRGHTIIIVTHDEFVASHCQKIYDLKEGELFER